MTRRTSDEPAFSARQTEPALGVVEVSSVARGMVVADAMSKKATIVVVRAAPVTPGKFVVVVTGGEEDVDQAMQKALEVASSTLIDKLFLARVDEQVPRVMRGEIQQVQVDAVGIVETFSVASTVLAADRAAKAAEVTLIQMRLARGLGGKAYFTLTGSLYHVEAAIEAARSIIHDGMLLTTEIIPRPHPDFAASLFDPPPFSR
ncbi:MAG: BMC domain-containing protein [Pseudomonadota bacterium]